MKIAANDQVTVNCQGKNMKAKHLKTMNLLLCLFSLSLFTGGNLWAQAGSANRESTKPAPRIGDYVELEESDQNEMYGTIDYPSADLKTIIQALSKLTGKNFILEENLPSKRISILSPTPVTKQEAYNAFISALYMNQLTIVSAGKFLKIINVKNSIRANTRVFYGDYVPNNEEVVTVIFPLKNLNAEEISRFVTDLIPRDGRVSAFPDTNALVMTDTGLNLRRIISVLRKLDLPGNQNQLESIEILHGSAKQIALLIEEILEAQNPRSTRRSSRRSKNIQKTRGGGLITKIVPDERTNSLVVLANGSGLRELKRLIDKLDTPTSSGNGNIHIYYCKHAKAEELATTINTLLSGSSNTRSTGGSGAAGSRTGTTPAPTPRTSRNNNRRSSRTAGGVSLEGNIRVTADKATNSLVVRASASDYTAMKEILTKLDIPRRQVYVEATIMEIKVQDREDFNLGVNVAGGGLAQAGGFNTLSSSDFASLLSSPGGLNGLLAGIASSNSVQVRVPNGTSTTTFDIPEAFALFQAIETMSHGQILHQPQILTADNEEANIEFIDNIPVPQEEQSTVSNTPISTTKFVDKKVKVSLKITPQIGENNDLVKLQVEQAIDDFSRVEQGQIQVTERLANTTVQVRHGDTVAIGGLQRRSASDSESRIPLLGDLPFVGWLFKGQKKDDSRTNMVLFLTPYIINEYGDLLEITKAKIDSRLKQGATMYSPKDRYRSLVKKMGKKNLRDMNRHARKKDPYKKTNTSAFIGDFVEPLPSSREADLPPDDAEELFDDAVPDSLGIEDNPEAVDLGPLPPPPPAPGASNDGELQAR